MQIKMQQGTASHWSEWPSLKIPRMTNAGENVGSLYCWWEFKLLQSLCRTVWRFLRKLKIELQNDPVIPLLGINLDKTILLKYTYTKTQQ